MSTLADGLMCKDNITSLTLDFRFCALDLDDTVKLCRTIAELPNVETLNLKLFGNRGVRGVIGDNFESMKHLRGALVEHDGGKKYDAYAEEEDGEVQVCIVCINEFNFLKIQSIPVIC